MKWLVSSLIRYRYKTGITYSHHNADVSQILISTYPWARFLAPTGILPPNPPSNSQLPNIVTIRKSTPLLWIRGLWAPLFWDSLQRLLMERQHCVKFRPSIRNTHCLQLDNWTFTLPLFPPLSPFSHTTIDLEKAHGPHFVSTSYNGLTRCCENLVSRPMNIYEPLASALGLLVPLGNYLNWRHPDLQVPELRPGHHSHKNVPQRWPGYYRSPGPWGGQL